MSKIFSSKLKTLLIIIGIVVVLLTAVMFFYLTGIGAVDSKSDKDVSVTIPQGSGAAAIVKILDEKGLVRNTLCAKIHARIGGYDSLQANTYVFSKSMSLPEMMKAINEGDFDYVSRQQFTVVEGATVPQAAEAMAKELPFTKDEILAAWADKTYLNKLINKYWFLTDEILADGIMYPLEGYLYPETYFVTSEDPSDRGSHNHDAGPYGQGPDQEKIRYQKSGHDCASVSDAFFCGRERISLQEGYARKSPVSLSTV